MTNGEEETNVLNEPLTTPKTDKDKDKAIEDEVWRKLAESDHKRRELAKELAVEVGKTTTKMSAEVRSHRARRQPFWNVCGILKRGFSNLGGDLKYLCYSVNQQFSSLNENLESNFNELLSAVGEGGAAGFGDDGESERPPISVMRIHTGASSLPGQTISDSNSETEEGGKLQNRKTRRASVSLRYWSNLSNSFQTSERTWMVSWLL